MKLTQCTLTHTRTHANTHLHIYRLTMIRKKKMEVGKEHIQMKGKVKINTVPAFMEVQIH